MQRLKLPLNTLSALAVISGLIGSSVSTVHAGSKKAQAKTPMTPLTTQKAAPSASSSTPTTQTTSSSSSSSPSDSNSAVSTANTQSTLDKIREVLNVQLSNEISGPTMENPDLNSLSSSNKLTLAYRTGMWRLGPVIQFSSKVAGEKAVDHFDMQDPYLRAANVSLFNNGNANLFADFRYYIPMTGATRSLDSLGSLRTTQVLTYTPSGSRMTALLIGIARVWGFNGSTVADGSKYVQLIGMPGLAYQFTPSIAFAGYYGAMENLRESADGKGPNWGYGDFLDLGLEFTVGRWVTINPYIELTPTQGINRANTTYQATLNWNLL